MENALNSGLHLASQEFPKRLKNGYFSTDFESKA